MKEKTKIEFSDNDIRIRLIAVYGEFGGFSHYKAVKNSSECQITVESKDTESVLDAFGKWSKELNL